MYRLASPLLPSSLKRGWQETYGRRGLSSTPTPLSRAETLAEQISNPTASRRYGLPESHHRPESCASTSKCMQGSYKPFSALRTLCSSSGLTLEKLLPKQQGHRGRRGLLSSRVVLCHVVLNKPTPHRSHILQKKKILTHV